MRAGPHRGSQFRTLVGLGLRELMGKTEPRSWGRGADANAAAAEQKVDAASITQAEAGLEAAVSLYVGQMPFLFLAVDDAPGPMSQRALIEKNSIALLSNYARPALDAPSQAGSGDAAGARRCRNRGCGPRSMWMLRMIRVSWTP